MGDVVGALGAAHIVRECYADQQGRSDFCDLITRSQSGNRSLTGVSTQLFNVAEERVRGIDVQERMAVPLMGGQIRAGLNYTRLLERSRRHFDGTPSADFAGRFDAIRDQARVSLGFARKALTIAYDARFLGRALKGTSAADRRAADDAEMAGDNSISIGVYIYHDMQASIAVGEALGFTVGVKNLTDLEPPLITEFSDAGSSAAPA